jgi:hypothetical protein
VQPDGEHRDVVLGVGQEEPLQHLVAEGVDGEAGALADHLDQLGDPGVEVAVPPLDQAVGVEEHGRARVEDGDVLPPPGLGRDAQQQLGLLLVEERDLALGGEHDGRRVPGAGPAQPHPSRPQVVLVLLEAGDERRGHRVECEALDRAVELGEHLGG